MIIFENKVHIVLLPTHPDWHAGASLYHLQKVATFSGILQHQVDFSQGRTIYMMEMSKHYKLWPFSWEIQILHICHTTGYVWTQRWVPPTVRLGPTLHFKDSSWLLQLVWVSRPNAKTKQIDPQFQAVMCDHPMHDWGSTLKHEETGAGGVRGGNGVVERAGVKTANYAQILK